MLFLSEQMFICPSPTVSIHFVTVDETLIEYWNQRTVQIVSFLRRLHQKRQRSFLQPVKLWRLFLGIFKKISSSTICKRWNYYSMSQLIPLQLVVKLMELGFQLIDISLLSGFGSYVSHITLNFLPVNFSIFAEHNSRPVE